LNSGCETMLYHCATQVISFHTNCDHGNINVEIHICYCYFAVIMREERVLHHMPPDSKCNLRIDKWQSVNQ